MFFCIDQKTGIKDFRTGKRMVPGGAFQGAGYSDQAAHCGDRLQIVIEQRSERLGEEWAQGVFIIFEIRGGAIGRFQGAPVLALPGIIVIHLDLPKSLSAMGAPGMADGDRQDMPTGIGADMAAVPVSLFLVVVHYFPDHLVLDDYGKSGDVRKIGGV